jgi:hypothetical protein|tara:strand:- start:1052 stop:1201 length:150 start_codon:yes stop_codon:yes gene_type:complete
MSIFKYSITTTFDRSITYLETLEDVRLEIKQRLRKDNKLKANQLQINKL